MTASFRRLASFILGFKTSNKSPKRQHFASLHGSLHKCAGASGGSALRNTTQLGSWRTSRSCEQASLRGVTVFVGLFWTLGAHSDFWDDPTHRATITYTRTWRFTSRTRPPCTLVHKRCFKCCGRYLTEAPAAQRNKQRDAFVRPGARSINISPLRAQTFTSGLNPLLLLSYANTV